MPNTFEIISRIWRRDQRVAASTQNQALNAIVFLYKRVLNQDPGDFSQTLRAKRSERLWPVVLTQGEVHLILTCLPKTTHGLIIHLLYGAGLRLKEAVRLRVQDLDFIKGVLLVRDGKGGKDRRCTLPEKIQPELKRHLKRVKAQFDRDRMDGFADVYLPNALARKYPNAAKEWKWQYVFPADFPSKDPRSGIIRRHHIYDRSVNSTIKKAVTLAGYTQEGDGSYIPSLVRHPSARIWIEYPNRAGIVRPQEHRNDSDLSTLPEYAGRDCGVAAGSVIDSSKSKVLSAKLVEPLRGTLLNRLLSASEVTSFV